MWLRDTGILKKLKYDVLNPPIHIPDPKVKHDQPLNLKQLGITGIMIIIGLFISLVVFLRELRMNRTKGSIPHAKETLEMSERSGARPSPSLSTNANHLPFQYADKSETANYKPIKGNSGSIELRAKIVVKNNITITITDHCNLNRPTSSRILTQVDN